MTVRVEDGVIRLEGACRVEDAEALLVALQDGHRSVDLREATRIHLALVQLLLAARPAIVGEPADPILRRIVAAPGESDA